MSNELIDMLNRITPGEKFVSRLLKSIWSDIICRRAQDILQKNEK